ncbi:hypothetical protein [Sphingomonas sp. G-3-2-10]|uniref:hypothetical protein n=1 Tax=Sphingomonas sp. G-3-2-10 TaxID=2728838 RepID=UPI00146D7B12|nr:hypothetical protein [Sphingomonas sp. G-3-2-10]NML04916.1 hypothetical protein [Sphingomonas sp. G-3-2-10]
MTTDHIPIELDEDGFSGTVRQEGFPGESLPDLIAHRPEPWRFLRLARVVGAARSIARDELGPDEAKAMINAMASICDYKGDFGVIWRDSGHKPVFEGVLNRALASEGEDEILHEIESDRSGIVPRSD